MVLNGKEIGFRRTVYANCKIAEMSPNHNINKINDIFKATDTMAQLDFAMNFIIAMNEGYEKAKAYNEPGYTPNPITREDLEYADIDELNDLFTEAAEAFRADGKVSVEVAQKKTGKKTALAPQK